MFNLDPEIQAIITDVCELPNRTSPEGYEHYMLITEDELEQILRKFAEAIKENMKQ